MRKHKVEHKGFYGCDFLWLIFNLRMVFNHRVLKSLWLIISKLNFLLVKFINY